MPDKNKNLPPEDFPPFPSIPSTLQQCLAPKYKDLFKHFNKRPAKVSTKFHQQNLLPLAQESCRDPAGGKPQSRNRKPVWRWLQNNNISLSQFVYLRKHQKSKKVKNKDTINCQGQ